MPNGTEMTREQSQRVSTYFSRYYKPGKRIKIPERIREKGKRGEDWIEWMRRRLKEIKFYDKHGMRTGETNKIPPRIFLRGDATPEEKERFKIDSSGIDEGHYEFKVWLQHKVEDARLGNGSIRFLASERPGNDMRRLSIGSRTVLRSFSSRGWTGSAPMGGILQFFGRSLEGRNLMSEAESTTLCGIGRGVLSNTKRVRKLH